MKKRIYLMMCLIIASKQSFSALPKETESYSVDRERCREVDVYESRGRYKCEKEAAPGGIVLGENKCEFVFEEVKVGTREECETETEYRQRETGFYNTKPAEKYASDTFEKMQEKERKAAPTFSDKIKAWWNGTTGEEEKNKRLDGKAVKTLSVYKEAARVSGEDPRDNPEITNKYYNKVSENERIAANKAVDKEVLKSINKSANSRALRELHGVNSDEYETFKNDRAYNPYEKPIKVNSENEITEDMKNSGKPIYIKREKEREEDDLSPIDDYNYYYITYNPNGATSGFVPPSIKGREYSFVKVYDNIGYLRKDGYEFLGWQTSPNGGTLYTPNSNLMVYNNLTLYAKWQKVYKTAIGKNITIKKGERPKAEDGILNKSELGNVTYSFKKEIDFNNIGEKNAIIVVKYEDGHILEVPIKVNVIEGEKITSTIEIRFFKNEYSVLSGESSFVINKNEKISSVPSVNVSSGYKFSGFKNIATGAILTKEEIIKINFNENTNFIVVTIQDEKTGIKWFNLTPAKRTTKVTSSNRPELEYFPLEVYVGDDVPIERAVNIAPHEHRYIFKWKQKPNTQSAGKVSGTIRVLDLAGKNDLYDDYEPVNITVLAKPNLEYKTIRTKEINKVIIPSDVVKNNLDNRFEIFITNTIDNTKIGTKEVHLKIVDNKLGREFTGFKTDIKLTEVMKEIPYLSDREVYVGDSVSIDKIVNKTKLPKNYIIEIETPVNTTTSGIINVPLIIKNSQSGSIWKKSTNIKVIKAPELQYKQTRKKEINQNILIPDVVENIIVDSFNEISKERYSIHIINDIDNKKIGKKSVQLKIVDTKNNRTFTGFSTDINLYENLKNLRYIEDGDIYIGESVNVDNVINKIDLPKEYTIEIKTQPDTNTSGNNKKFIVIIKNPTSGSVWEVERSINVLDKPKLKANLWIYQNDKNPEEKAKSFIPVIKVDLNDRFPYRYIIKFKKAGNISNLGNSKFTYTVTDVLKNKSFDVDIDIEVREEIIEPKINKNAEYYIGAYPNIDELVTNINKLNYEIKIVNLEELKISRLSPGIKNVRIQIISKITGKIFNIDVPILYKEKYVDLGELNIEQGEDLNLDIIRKYKQIDKGFELSLRKGILSSNKIGSYDVEIIIKNKDGVYVVARLKINIVENRTFKDFSKIDEFNKVHLINFVDSISDKISSNLINSRITKSNGLWLEQSRVNYKYNSDVNANVNGLRLGYDKLLNNNTLIGIYTGYDKAKIMLSDLSEQNMLHNGLYAGKKFKMKNDHNIVIGTVLDYSNITGKINFKNIHDEKSKYIQKTHNIVVNNFIGLSKEDKISNYSVILKIGDTFVYMPKNTLKSNDKNISLNNTLVNEFYAEWYANKKIYYFDIFGSFKIGYMTGKPTYIINGHSFENVIKKVNAYGKIGADYNFNENHKIGLEGQIKNKDNQLKFNSTIKAKYEYRW